MDKNPGLAVRLYLNVARPYRDAATTDGELLRKFADRFRKQVWPGKRMPEVFYDPRALTSGGEVRACMHAKCIVVDDAHVFISSANFTEAAHERNIEAGVRLDDVQMAQRFASSSRRCANATCCAPCPDCDPRPAQTVTDQHSDPRVFGSSDTSPSDHVRCAASASDAPAPTVHFYGSNSLARVLAARHTS